MPLERHRMAWLDSLRGWGVALVVIGHCLSGGVLREWIYNFHVPLLFVLSGYLNELLYDGARRFRVKRILLPYMIWAFISASFYLLFNMDRSALWLLNDIIPVCGFSSWNAPLWFLYVLIFVGLLKPLWRDCKSYIPLFLFGVVVLCICVIFPNVSNALAWRNVFLGITCVGIGESLARYNVVEKAVRNRTAPIAMLVLGSVVGICNGPVSIYGCYYGRTVWMLAIASILISIALMAIFKRCEHVFPAWLGLLGRCSLFIMVSHYFALLIIGRVVYKILGTDPDNIFCQLGLGVLILCAYLLYFKVLSVCNLNYRLPDYLGGFKDLKEK